jgi:hypothetical protein
MPGRVRSSGNDEARLFMSGDEPLGVQILF